MMRKFLKHMFILNTTLGVFVQASISDNTSGQPNQTVSTTPTVRPASENVHLDMADLAALDNIADPYYNNPQYSWPESSNLQYSPLLANADEITNGPPLARSMFIDSEPSDITLVPIDPHTVGNWQCFDQMIAQVPVSDDPGQAEFPSISVVDSNGCLVNAQVIAFLPDLDENSPLTTADATANTVLRLSDLIDFYIEYVQKFNRSLTCNWEANNNNNIKYIFNKAVYELFINMIHTLTKCEAWYRVGFNWEADNSDKSIPPYISKISIGAKIPYLSQVHERLKSLMESVIACHSNFQHDISKLLSVLGRETIWLAKNYLVRSPNSFPDKFANLHLELPVSSDINFKNNIEKPCLAIVELLTEMERALPPYSMDFKLADLIVRVYEHASYLDQLYLQTVEAIETLIHKHAYVRDKYDIAPRLTAYRTTSRHKQFRVARSTIEDRYVKECLIEWTKDQLNNMLALLFKLVRYRPELVKYNIDARYKLCKRINDTFKPYVL